MNTVITATNLSPEEQQLKNNLRKILIGLRTVMEKAQTANRRVYMGDWVFDEDTIDDSTHVEDCGTPCCVIGYASLDDEFEEVMEKLKLENTEFNTRYNTINKSDLLHRAGKLNTDIRELLTPTEEFSESKTGQYICIYSSVMWPEHQERESDYKQALQKMGLNPDDFEPHRHLTNDDVTPSDVIEHINICLSLIEEKGND